MVNLNLDRRWNFQLSVLGYAYLSPIAQFPFYPNIYLAFLFLIYSFTDSLILQMQTLAAILLWVCSSSAHNLWKLIFVISWFITTYNLTYL